MLPYNDKQNFDKWMLEQNNGEIEYIGAFLRDRAVGQVILNLKGKQGVDHITGGRFCADVGNLFVVYALRRIGVGTALLRHVERECASRGIEYVGLGVNVEESGDAHRLYRHLGFVDTDVCDHVEYEVREENGEVRTVEEDCIYMIKEVEEKRDDGL